MDFIEQFFGFAPDGGTGTLEFLLFALPVLVVCLLFAARSGQKKHRSLVQSCRLSSLRRHCQFLI
jgi:hypothetical protein